MVQYWATCSECQKNPTSAHLDSVPLWQCLEARLREPRQQTPGAPSPCACSLASALWCRTRKGARPTQPGSHFPCGGAFRRRQHVTASQYSSVQCSTVLYVDAEIFSGALGEASMGFVFRFLMQGEQRGAHPSQPNGTVTATVCVNVTVPVIVTVSCCNGASPEAQDPEVSYALSAFSTSLSSQSKRSNSLQHRRPGAE